MTTHIPAAAERAKGVDSGTNRVGSRAFHVVACNKKLPVRVENIITIGRRLFLSSCRPVEFIDLTIVFGHESPVNGR